MERHEKEYDYPIFNGQASTYRVETLKRDDSGPLIIIRNSPDNVGPKFYDYPASRSEVTTRAMDQAVKNYKLQPNQISMFRERSDGRYDQVTFRNIGWSDHLKTVQWTEATSSAAPYTKEQVKQKIQGYIARDKDVKADFEKQTNLAKASIPGLDRNSISKDERREMAKKVQGQEELQNKQKKEQKHKL